MQRKDTKPIRVAQVIDSLDAGGGERMAVTLANSLKGRVDFSGLVVTRKEGDLRHLVDDDIPYCFIQKQRTVDPKAVRRFHRFIQKNEITILHAHATSFFTAYLVKLLNPGIKLIWHDHYGESESLDSRPNKAILKFCSKSFGAIFSVNTNLQQWAKKELKYQEVHYLKNFSTTSNTTIKQVTQLKGEGTSFKIVQVANLRPQKDHLNALKAVHILQQRAKNITIHLIGAYKQDEHFDQLKNYIKANKLDDLVFIYGSCPDVVAILAQGDLGILSSRSEGLPVSLLEYAKAVLPVVVTDVGQCDEVVGEYGHVVPPQDAPQLANAIQDYLEKPEQAKKDALELNKKVEKEYGEKAIIDQIVEVYGK